MKRNIEKSSQSGGFKFLAARAVRIPCCCSDVFLRIFGLQAIGYTVVFILYLFMPAHNRHIIDSHAEDRLTHDDGTVSVRYKDPADFLMNAVGKKPSVALFYSKDCAPCHVEINMLPELKKAMEGDHIAVVSLTSPDKALTEKLKDLDVQLVDASSQDALALLRTFNDQHLALPFSMALDEKGIVCARRAGLLGLDIIKDWRKKCLQ